MSLLLFAAVSTFTSALLASPVRCNKSGKINIMLSCYNNDKLLYHIILDLTDYERLFEHILSDYNKNVEPFEAPGHKIEVEFGITPIYLDLDQNGILKVGRIQLI